jgi:hypothetical protein
MTQRSLVLTAAMAAAFAGGALAQTVSTDATVVVPGPATVVVPTAPGTTYYYTAEPASVPMTRAEVQSEGSATMHGGGVARGEALATRNRPHGGAINADPPTTGAAAGHTNGINGWSNGPAGDGG